MQGRAGCRPDSFYAGRGRTLIKRLSCHKCYHHGFDDLAWEFQVVRR